MKTLLQKITTSLFVLVIAMMAMPQSNADAQYCGFENKLYWTQYSMIARVTVTDLTEGTTIIDRESNYERWADVSVTEGPYEMNIGNDFLIEVYWGGAYGEYLRAYIDRNDDQRWESNQVGPDQEYIGYIYKYFGFNFPAFATDIDQFEFSIGDDVPEGPSVLRIMCNYNWLLNDPCELYFVAGQPYAYGEVEDYAINFAAPIPETYPTNGNILFNEEAYDGTERMYNGNLIDFKLPAVEFKGPQPEGNKFMYSISGPIPSNDVVYTALDPVTGEEEIDIEAGATAIDIASAIGSASVDINEGTFLPTKGGIYKVNVALIKASGKKAEGINTFTVANDFDMSIVKVESPTTSREPMFFKYDISTPIRISCVVQNSGLNPVSKFEVMAKIYDADTDIMIEELPTYTFDSDNDPNVLPLGSIQQMEVEFPSFEEDNVGEYYVTFEVDYKYDEEEFNNYLPREGASKHFFEIQYNDQLSAGEFQTPKEGDTLKVNKPYDANVFFENNGIADASNINFRMVVTNENGDEVYNGISFLEDLPQGRYNDRIVKFPTLLIAEEGNYTACAWVDYLADPIKSDDTVCVSFYVEKGIQDTITVGETNSLTEVTNNDVVSNENPSDDNNNNVVVENAELFAFTNITPNPAMTTTKLDFTNESNEVLSLEVVDMNGNVVQTGRVEGTTHNLNVSDLSSGNYTIVVRSGNTVQTRQLNVVK